MAHNTKSNWKRNKYTEDLVYSYADGTMIRYHITQTQEIQEVIFQDGVVTARRPVPVEEMTLEQFYEFKAWSDCDYHEEDKAYVRETSNTLSFDALSRTSIPSTPFSSPSIEEDNPYTFENACAVLEQMKASETQIRRYLQYAETKSTCEIARKEGVNSKTVWKSIHAFEKRRDKVLKKFLKNF